MRRNWKRLGIGIVGAAGVLACLGILTGAQAQCVGGKTTAKPAVAGPSPLGEPDGFRKGETWRYAVWYDTKAKGWRLRTTTAKALHHFKGSITVEGGNVSSITSYMLEASGKYENAAQGAPPR